MVKINKFSEDGYVVLKKAISQKLLKEIRNEIYNITIPKKIKHDFNSFEKITRIIIKKIAGRKMRNILSILVNILVISLNSIYSLYESVKF